MTGSKKDPHENAAKTWLREWLPDSDVEAPIDLQKVFEGMKVRSRIVDGEERRCLMKTLFGKDIRRDKRMSVQIASEISTLKLCRHPHIVHLLDFFICPEFSSIVIEHTGEVDIDIYLKENKFNERLTQALFAQMVSGVSYMHSKGIAHRFLNPGSVRVFRNNKCVKIDCLHYSSEFTADKTKSRLLNIVDESRVFAAPEMKHNPSIYNGQRGDIWSMGVILYTMLCGYDPYSNFLTGGIFQFAAYNYIAQNPLKFPNRVAGKARDIIRRMLNYEPKGRIKMPDILTHQWLTAHHQFLAVVPEEYEHSGAPQKVEEKKIATEPNTEPDNDSDLRADLVEQVSSPLKRVGRKSSRLSMHKPNSVAARAGAQAPHRHSRHTKLTRKQLMSITSESECTQSVQPVRPVLTVQSSNELNIQNNKSRKHIG